MRYLISILILTFGCSSNDDSLLRAQCETQATTWCSVAWAQANPRGLDLSHEIAQCEAWYTSECATGDLLTDEQTCLDAITSNETVAPYCIPLACASTWDTGPGKDNLSRACRI